MPAFPENQHSEQELADFFAYFTSLPRVAQPAPWRTPLPTGAPKGQELLIATYGCGQCHGALMGGPRADAGAINADFAWFRGMTFAHTTVMPEHRKLLNEAPARVRMATTRRPASGARPREIFRYLKDDLKFRAALLSRRLGTSPGLQPPRRNEGWQGLAAETTVLLALPPGTKVTIHRRGYRASALIGAQSEVAFWHFPAQSNRTRITRCGRGGGGIARGVCGGPILCRTGIRTDQRRDAGSDADELTLRSRVAVQNWRRS